MRIGILTGGGDVPGLNVAIKTVVTRAEREGHEVVGFRRGWMGLLHLNTDDPASIAEFSLKLNYDNTRTVDRTGGTFLHTSRTNPQNVAPGMVPDFIPAKFRTERADGKVDCTAHVLDVLEKMGIDVLIPIGGDDTLGYASRLHQEGFPMVSIPKTMDNDVFGTDFCIGFSTAVTRSVSLIHQMRTSVGSHERIGVVELFGRNSGETSLIAAYLAGVDRAIISEVPFDIEKLADMLARDKKRNSSHYCFVTISEGATPIGGEIVQTGKADPFGHQKLGGIGPWTAGELERLTGEQTMVQNLAYLMRSGPPDALDIMVATNYACCAMDLIKEGKYGRMTALQDGKYTHVEADSPIKGLKTVDIEAFYDVDEYRPAVKNALGMPMFLH
jgi:6-phosphofructokinase 1